MAGFKHTYNIKVLYAELFIIIFVFRGIIDNFIGYGTLMVDVITFGMVPLELILDNGKITQSKRKLELMKFYIIWVILSFIILSFQIFMDRISLYTGLLGIRNDIMYTLPFLFFASGFSAQNYKKVYSAFLNCAFIINLLAIMQYCGRSVLPDLLLSLKNEDFFNLYGIDIIRVNGLVGNTIIYGGFVIVSISLIWAQLISSGFRSLRLWVQFCVAVLADSLTFSRASIVGMVCVILLEYLIDPQKKEQNKKIYRIFIALILTTFGCTIILLMFSDSIIVQRLLGTNSAWIEGSDQIHFSTIDDALAVIKENALLGYGIGTVGYSSPYGSNAVITDGTFWIYLIEYGIPYCLIFWTIVVITIQHSIKAKDSCDAFFHHLCVGFVGANAYLIPFAVINSAYSARIVLLSIWMLCGMTYGYERAYKREHII